MKLRLPVLLRKALILSALACHVQANTTEDPMSPGRVFYVFDSGVQAGMSEQTAPQSLDTLVQSPVEEATEENGGVLSMREEFCYFNLPLQPSIVTSTQVSFVDRRHVPKVDARSRQAAMSEQDFAADALERAISYLYDGVETEDEIIHVEHRGKGVVRRERQVDNRWPFGIWDEEAALFGPFLIPHFFYDGYVGVWVGGTQKVYITDTTTGTSQNGQTIVYQKPKPQPVAVPTPVHAPYYGRRPTSGRTLSATSVSNTSGGSSPSATQTVASVLNPGSYTSLTGQGDQSSLSGDWTLDLSRSVEFACNASSTPLSIQNGTLDLKTGKGLSINLVGNWDGASAGTFDLVSLGSNGTISLNGADMEEGVDYLSDLGSVVVSYKDADGKTATINLADAANGLGYSLQVSNGKLSLVVTDPAAEASVLESAPALQAPATLNPAKVAGVSPAVQRLAAPTSVSSYNVPVEVAGASSDSLLKASRLSEVSSTAPQPVISGEDATPPAIKDGNNYHWSADNGAAFTWSTSKWGTENYTNSTASNIFFDDAADDAQGAKTFTVNLGSANVTAGSMTVTGNDTYHIVSPTGGRKIKVNNFTMDGGTLYYNGDSSNDVALDIAGTGTFRMDNGAYAEFRKVNAQNLGRVELDNGSKLVVTRDIASLSDSASSFEARYLVIDHNSTLEARSAGYGIKIADAEIKNGGKLIVSAPFLHYMKGGNGALSDIHITLANGGILENTKSATADAITIGYIAGRTADITSTLTATGTSDSYLRGFWRLGTNTAAQAANAILDVSGDYRPIVIGGDANIDSSLIIGKAGWTLNLGDKWDGTSAMADPITLFTAGTNGVISIGNDIFEGSVDNCLQSLNNFYVSYGTGANKTTVDLKVAIDALQPHLSYQDGQLVFSILNRGEYVWHYDKGETMTWTQQNWDDTPYAYQSSVKFISNGDDAVQTITVAVNSQVDEQPEYLVAHNIEVEGEDTFVWNVDGRIQAGSLTKSGSGDLTINALDLGARPTVDIVAGAFTVTGGNVTANAQLRAKYYVIDGTQNAVTFTDQYKVNGNPDPAITNTQDSVIINGAGGYFRIIGTGAQADINRICSSNNNNDTTVEVLDGAALNLYRGSTSLEVRNVVVSGSDSRLNMNTGSIRVSNLTIADGGYVATKNRFISTSYNETVPNMALNLRNGGVLENTGSNPITLNRVESTSGGNTYKSELTLELSGATPSVLLGDWMWDASIKSTITYADASSAALTIRNGTFNIFNTTVATETDALTIDLSSHWDGDADITRRILRFGSGGVFNVNGQSVAAGDITSLFNNVYVRYTDSEGQVQTINLSSPEALNNPEHYYQLLWENNSLFFTSSTYDENGPFEWRHSYEELYGTRNPDDTLTAYQLTWKHGGEWHPDSHNYDGPTTGNPSQLFYRNEHAVSFMGDTDEEVDTVHVTIDGTVAPGDFVHGVAGIRVTGADNFVFSGVNNATIADVTIDKQVTTADGTPQIIKEIKTATTLSKSGTGTLTIAGNVKLDYTGRTEVLGGKLELLGPAWTPAGTVTVAEGATLQVGDSDHMGSMSTNVFTVGTNMVDNNGYIQTNIVHTTGTTVTGDGRWNACYYLLEKTNFHAGIVELPPLVGSSIRASYVHNNGDATISQYFSGAGQNLTLMNRGFMTVEGTHGATDADAAVEVYNAIITGAGSGLDFTGKPVKQGGNIISHATLRAEVIDLSHGALLGLTQALEHVDNNKLTFTLGYGSTIRNNGTSAIVLNPNADAQFDLIVKATDTPNYFEGNWTVDLSHPFLLDYSHFDNQTVVVPVEVHEGTMTLANADRSYNADTGLSNFIFRADGLKYDTLEIMTVGERGKIGLSVERSGKTVNTVLVNDTDYFNDLKSMGYIFHVDANGQEVGWRYVDLVKMQTLKDATFDTDGNITGYTGVKTLTETEFAEFTGLDKGLNFQLLYERNILSLVVAPDGPVGTRQYYFWSGRSTSGATQGNYDTWTRHNSTELSPWSDDDIFQNGYLTIFADVDIHGNKIGSYTVEIENSVATGSKPLEGVTRPGFEVAAIHFDNRSVTGYTVQSDKYHGSGCIADIYEYDANGNRVEDVTKLIVNGGYVEIKTNNTYGGKLSTSSDSTIPTTIVKSVSYTETDGEGGAHAAAGAESLFGKTVEEARAAHLVNYSRYGYAYKDEAGEIHFITEAQFNSGAYADCNPERVYLTQRSDGSNNWSVRGNTIEMTVMDNIVAAYEGEVKYAHAYTSKDAQGNSHVHFISADDWAAGTYAKENAMEVILTPIAESRSWHINGVGTEDRPGIFETVDSADFDESLVSHTSSTVAYAYKTTTGEGGEAVSKLNFISEADFNTWNDWNNATGQDKTDLMTAWQQSNPTLAGYAAAHEDLVVERVNVQRTVNSNNVSEIRWTVSNDDFGSFELTFDEFAPNKVYAYKDASDHVHVLTENEYNAWKAGDAAYAGKDIQAVSEFGPINNQWNLYTTNGDGTRDVWGTTTVRPEFVATENAYLRTYDDYHSYAYTTTDASSGLNHVHLISQADYEAWTAGDFSAISDATLAQFAQNNTGILPQEVYMTPYANEQSYHVTGAGVHGSLTTNGLANNCTYGYATVKLGEDGFPAYDESGNQLYDYHFVTESQYKAWKAWAAADAEAATQDAKDTAYTTFVAAVGQEFAENAKTLTDKSLDEYHYVTDQQKAAWNTWVAADAAATNADEKQAAMDTFVAAVGESFAQTAQGLVGITPERIDLAYMSEIDNSAGGVTHNYWALRGSTISGRVDTLVGNHTYGYAVLYAYKDGEEYKFITQDEYLAWNPVDHGGAQAYRVNMTAESEIVVNGQGELLTDPVWSLSVVGTGDTIPFESIDMATLGNKVYGFAYNIVDSLGRTHIHFVSAEDYELGIRDYANPLPVKFTISGTPGNIIWNVAGGVIDEVVDVSSIAFDDTRTEHYTYIARVMENGVSTAQFISERDVNDGNYPANIIRDAQGKPLVEKLVIVQQSDGKWFMPEYGYTMVKQAVEITVDTNEFFGYGYYDSRGQLHLTTLDAYYADNGSTLADPAYKTELGNTQLIRLAYNKETGEWYTPGVLIASNERAFGTSEVSIGTGSRLLATTNLFVTSLTLEQGANVIARQNLDINKPLTVSEKSYMEVDGKLDVTSITVQNGATFTTHDVKAKKVTVESGATWNLNDNQQSLLDISERLILNGGATLIGSALMRDGLLEVHSGDSANPYVTLTGTLKLGVDATLDLSHLLPEGEDKHYRSSLMVAEGGALVLEPHDAILLSMSQVNHLLGDHINTAAGTTIEQKYHVLHVATLGAGANFSISNTLQNEDGTLYTVEVPLDLDDSDNYAKAQHVELAEGLGYMVDALLQRRHISDGYENGLDEVVLHLDLKEDAPAYVWDGIYNGRNHAENNNIWCMYNGSTGMDDLEHAKFAWSGKAVYGDPQNVDPSKPYLNWGQEVYFLEVGFDKNQKSAFDFHYVNDAGISPDKDPLTDRAKYVDIRGEVWSRNITVDVDRLYDMTLDQYLRNVGYLFYSSDGTGTITDCWYDKTTGATYALSAYSAGEAADLGLERQATNIVKNGTGVLTLNTDNSFTGNIYLNSGSVFGTSEQAFGKSHVLMQDQTSLFINYLFEMKGDSAYRNPVLSNEITVWGGGNFAAQSERAIGGDRIIAVTIGYNPISVIDVMCDISGEGDTSQMREESTSRHWRTLSITGPLHGGDNTEITLQGYTSYTGGLVYTSMFWIYGSEGETDFSGTIKLQNYRNLSPAAYSSVGNTFMNDTNLQRGTGAVELMLSDATLQYATLDLTRANVLASYTKDDAKKTEGFGRRQTPTHVVLLRGDSAVAGLNADFLGTIVRAQCEADGTAHTGQVEILVATQEQELASVRTIATGNYTLSLHSDTAQDFVYSGVLGGKYAYAGEGSGTIPEAGEDATGARISNGMVSLVHTGDGAQYIHSGFLQDLTIGNEVAGAHEQASGGTVGFHYLDLQGNLTLHSGATLKLDVDDCVRTAVQEGDAVNVHWDESAFSSDNVTIQAKRHANIITTRTTTAKVPDLSADGSEAVTVIREVPLGSYIDGNLTVSNDSFLDFYSRGIEPLPVVEGHTSADWAQQMTNPAFHPEAGVAVTAPDTGYLLDISGALILKGDVHVDFAGVEFDSAKNGVTYFLARAQKGLIGTVTQQTISLGNGYYGVIRGLETYDRKVTKVELPGNGTTYVPPTAVTADGTDLTLDALTEVRVNLTAATDGSTDYFFNYKTYAEDADGVETMTESTLTLTQVSGNVYHYDVNGNSYEAVLLYTYDNLGNVTSTAARMNLISLAYQDNAGYIIMTVTNTPPRVWFNTDNVIAPTREIGVRDEDDAYAAGKRIMVTPDGTKYINAADDTQYDGALGFGDVSVDTLWTGHGPAAASWIDSHLAFEPGCRVQFNKYGTARYQEVDGDMVYTRGNYTLTAAPDGSGEFGLEQAGIWRSMVAEMYGEQFDIVELEGNVQARSIFVNCETGNHADDGTLLINSPRSGYVNYWFRSAAGEDPGYIGDIEVTDINRDALSANIYDVKIGQVLAVTLEKTGGGYLRISTHNSYSGGTLLKGGSLIIDCDDALGMASTKQEAGGGDGALHAFGGTTLFINYVGDNDTAKFTNDIKIYSADTSVIGTAGEAAARAQGFAVNNGINLKGGTTNVHFVELNGAVKAVDADSVLTLSGLIVAENTKGYRDFTSFSLANLADYSGVVRMDSHFASNAEGIGSVDGIYEKPDGTYDYVLREREFKRQDTNAVVAPANVKSYYDSKNRQIVYYIDETEDGTPKRTYLTCTDTYRSVTDPSVTYSGEEAAKVITGGEVELRVTGNTLGSAVVDLSLNSAYHNALVLDMTGSTTLGGVRGLVGGELVKDANGDWAGYNSNVVAAKSSKLNMDVSYGDSTYAGTVGYGYYHAGQGSNIGLVHASSVMAMEKNGSSMQTIYSARLNNLDIKEGNVQFVKDLILSGKLTMAKETQLVIGTIDDVNYTSTNKAPYSIVVQGDGVLALGDAHTTTYTTTQDNGNEFSVTNTWNKFETSITAYNQEDKNPDALLRGGTLTAVTDVSTSISARFEDSFTINTHDYDYESDLLASEGITKSEVEPTHTITLQGQLSGHGVVTVTGGGTLVLDGRQYEVHEKDNLGNQLGTDKTGNIFTSAEAMAFRVQDGTTMRLAKDHALTYYDEVMEEKTYSYTNGSGNNASKKVLVSTGGTKVMQGASTVEVLADSHLVVDEDVHAQIAAARFVDNGDLIVEGAEHITLATVASRDGNTATDDAATALYGAGGNPDTLNISNVEVASDEGKAAFTGMYEDKADNTICNNALVTVSAGVEATMTNLTLGSAIKTGEGAQQDLTLAKLESEASLTLDNVVVESYATVKGDDVYTGVKSADGRELVTFNNTTVMASLGDNLLSPTETFVFTGADGSVDYANKNTAYTYSENYYQKDAGQAVYTLTNFQNCVIGGDGGQLTLQMSLADYNTLLDAAGDTKLLGIYMPGVAVLDSVSENLLSFATVDEAGEVVKRDSVFYVTANNYVADTNNGTVFYIRTELIPEPTTATLSLLALAALAARRRRKK